MFYHKWKILTIVLLAFILFFGNNVYADKAEELRQKIDEQNVLLNQLKQEIAQYQDQVDVISNQANTLKGTVDGLEITRKKLSKDIQITQNKIQTANIVIEQLKLDIGDKSNRIEEDIKIISKTFYKINVEESKSLIETLIEFGDLGEFWNELEKLTRFQSTIRETIKDLEDTKIQLEQNKIKTEKNKVQLLSFSNQLKGQTKSVEDIKKEKADLLAQTKNQEANYKKILDNKKALAKAFEDDLANLEQELRITIDPNSIPKAGAGVLQWPLDNVHITQYFGNTNFATQNPQAYNGKGHNGIDLRATTGTPVRTVLSGTIVEIGDTGILPNCYSYGRWILVKHNNGLSTVYAHLSSQLVSAGQEVKTGDIIAYSGYSGYVLPPGPSGAHLHFSVYATQGIQVSPLVNSINCKNIRIPVATQKAYLNPLSYL
ncbi:MAG: peptidoglycan DD-metalloendopeptidase family protein [Patescibacteria group bacterium]|nr:peptidoglycan DD-metalloendopeptidase family protein [Patescibacteria group bacterium]